jgi:hypothetical protein
VSFLLSAPESIITVSAQTPPPPALPLLGKIQLGLAVDLGGGKTMKNGVQTKTIKKPTENFYIIRMYIF